MSGGDLEAALRGLGCLALVVAPEAPVRSAVVIGMPAMGIGSRVRADARRLAELGHLVVVPDYYRGGGPEDPDALDGPEHLDELKVLMVGLDFVRATQDLLAAVDLLRDSGEVDQVHVWGYCTGGTIAALAACVGRRAVTSAVLFYPSQMVFPELTALRPVSPLDLLWSVTAPTLLLVGDADGSCPMPLVDETARRAAAWGAPVEHIVYPGCGHAFVDHWGDSFDAAAAADSWERATAWSAPERFRP
jgi:carboxymethylenebutenolidase